MDGQGLPAREGDSEGVIPMLWCLPLLKGDGCPQFREISQEPTWLAGARIAGKFKVAVLCLGAWDKAQKPPKRVVTSLSTLDCTLQLGWMDAGEGTPLQVGGPLGAGELSIVHVGLVRDTTVNRVTSHRSVPLSRVAHQHHLLLWRKQGSIRPL